MSIVITEIWLILDHTYVESY